MTTKKKSPIKHNTSVSHLDVWQRASVFWNLKSVNNM